MADIVYIDDKPRELLGNVRGNDRKRFADFLYGDEAAAFEEARDANLWVFDFFLEEGGEFEERLSENGLSLFHRWRKVLNTRRPVAAVVSNYLEAALGSPLGPPSRYHIHARRLGVEWIGDKNDGSSIRRLLELADASRTLAERLSIAGGLDATAAQDEENPTAFGIDNLCFDLLSAPREADWCTTVERQVDRARPPRMAPAPPHAARGAARRIIAWLLHNVLPYPSFMLTESHAALRLGITIESFRALVQGESELSQWLKSARYQGPLSEFDQSRWWRAGIDNISWRMAQNGADYNSAMSRAAGEIAISMLTEKAPVIVSDSDLVETDEITEAEKCVRATDEDFPADVDPAWVKISDAKEDRKLRAKVVFEDLEVLEEAHDN